MALGRRRESRDGRRSLRSASESQRGVTSGELFQPLGQLGSRRRQAARVDQPHSRRRWARGSARPGSACLVSARKGRGRGKDGVRGADGPERPPARSGRPWGLNVRVRSATWQFGPATAARKCSADTRRLRLAGGEPDALHSPLGRARTREGSAGRRRGLGRRRPGRALAAARCRHTHEHAQINAPQAFCPKPNVKRGVSGSRLKDSIGPRPPDSPRCAGRGVVGGSRAERRSWTEVPAARRRGSGARAPGADAPAFGPPTVVRTLATLVRIRPRTPASRARARAGAPKDHRRSPPLPSPGPRRRVFPRQRCLDSPPTHPRPSKGHGRH